MDWSDYAFMPGPFRPPEPRPRQHSRTVGPLRPGYKPFVVMQAESGDIYALKAQTQEEALAALDTDEFSREMGVLRAIYVPARTKAESLGYARSQGWR